MEKTARKPSTDPAQEKLRQNKANWNKEVSALVNDLIHFKKMMNGWPSKFYKERTRITEPIPADPATIIGSLAGDFQELVNRGNGIIQEQLNYSKTRRQKQPKQLNLPLGKPQETAPPQEAPAPPAPDLSKQLQLGLGASSGNSNMIKLASEFEEKYFLVSEASNPFTRFVTRLFNPKFGFGEGARIRRLRMTMLDNCVKTHKGLKALQKEIVKSSKNSIVTSHKMMTLIWNYWNAVNRLLVTFKALKPGAVKDVGGKIEEDPEIKRERNLEEGREPGEDAPPPEPAPDTTVISKLKDFKTAAPSIGVAAKNPAFSNFNSMLEQFNLLPKEKKIVELKRIDFAGAYDAALTSTNQELGTQGISFQEIAQQLKSKVPPKQAQLKELRKVRHQILPGATSGSRLEVFNLITQIRRDLDNTMNLLESGFDIEKLTQSVKQVNQQMTVLRTMMRSLYYSEKPEEASSPFM